MTDIMTSGRSLQILLVEDEPLIRLVAADMLALLGFGVLEAGAGAEALDFVRDKPVDCLMIDLGLPDLPGEAVIRQVRDLRPGTPVIVTTGADTVAASRRLTDCGVIAFLEKPYYLKDLERAVADIPALARTAATL